MKPINTSTTPLLIPAVCLILGIVAAPLVHIGWWMLVLFGGSVALTWLLYRW